MKGGLGHSSGQASLRDARDNAALRLNDMSHNAAEFFSTHVARAMALPAMFVTCAIDTRT